jgi:hypothetical protein
MLNDLREQLTKAFEDLFATNVLTFWDGFKGGGPGYYGVLVEPVAPDGSEVDLVLTFRSGRRYCCFEFCCHFAFYAEHGWSRLRGCLDRHGLSALPLPVIRKVRGVIERGAVGTPSPKVAAVIMAGSEYQTGPFQPVTEPDGKNATAGRSRGEARA